MKLNERNNLTKGIIHIMTTTLCDRKCKDCCNNAYTYESVPYVTKEELEQAHTLCLTGGEPFLYVDFCNMAKHFKRKYPNIKKVYVYGNALELEMYLKKGGDIHDINGLSVSIKTPIDSLAFKRTVKCNEKVLSLESNILYVFDKLYTDLNTKGFNVIEREWQPYNSFKPATDSIFRKI